MKKIKVKKISVLGIMTALSVVLIYFIRFPIFPIIDFMEYDAGDIPIFLCTYLYGSGYGIIVGVIASIIQGITVSAKAGFIGIIMHIFSIISYNVTVGLIFKKKEKISSLIIASIMGVLVMTLFMVMWNLIITPIYTGWPREAIVSILPYIIGFNLIKSGVNTIITVFLYKILNQKVFRKIIQ